MKTVIVIGCAIIVAIMVWFAYNPSGPMTPEEYRAWNNARIEAQVAAKEAERRSRPPTKEEVLALVNMHTYWRQEASRIVMMADLAVVNASDTRVKDLVVSCQQFAPSGTYLGTIRHTVYEQIPPRSYDWTLKFKGVNMGLVHPSTINISCRIEDLTILSYEPKTTTAAR